jgi:hypothetical protein
VYLGLGLRLGSGTFASYDSDAATYFNTAGVTDATAKLQINSFVLGVKGLGLWGNMVCWPLRSTQNKGSGTIVYSLGGLGTYNGTMVNGPTWGTDGIVFDGTNDYIITGVEISDYPSGVSILSVFNAPTDTQDFSMFFGDEGDGGSGRHFGMIRRNGSANQVSISTNFSSMLALSIQDITFGQFNQVHARVVAPSNFISVNSTAEASATGSGTFTVTPITEDRIGFGARQKATTPAFFAKMTASFGALFSSGTSSSQMQSVKSLYKTTLGTGLGLP